VDGSGWWSWWSEWWLVLSKLLVVRGDWSGGRW
jgi:hypothetical protein